MAEKPPTTIQTLILSKDKFKTAEDAKKWAAEHDFESPDVDETEDSFRLRQRDPEGFVDDSFRTIEITDGVKAVVGHLKSAKYTITVEDMRTICSPCAEKMERDGIKSFNIDLDADDLGQPDISTEVRDGLRTFALGESHNIDGVEIFASGEWNGDKYSDKDLDGIVSAFKETKSALKPYIKLGHSEDQKLLAEDSLPAAGWIENVRRVGSKLIADFRDMPVRIYELVRARAYKRVSSELFVNLKIGAKKYPFALKAVALLGGETPAVQTLEDIAALYSSADPIRAYETDAEVKAYEFASAQQEANPMPEEIKPEAPKPDGEECYKKLAELQMKHDEMAKQMEGMLPKGELDKQIAPFKAEAETAKAELVKATEELGKIAAEKRMADAKARVEKFVQDKKILPSQALALEALLIHAKESGVRKFKLGDKDIESEEELILAFVENGAGSGLPTEPISEQGKSSEVTDPNDGSAMDRAVREFMAKTGEKSYVKAYTAVAKEIAERQSQETPKA